MFSALLVAACLGVVAAQDAAVDSHGHLAYVMRRETPQRHVSLMEHLLGAPDSVAPPVVALPRTDLNYNFIEEQAAQICTSHFEYKGIVTNAKCAEHCYNTPGCMRFSAGGCADGCRISKAGTNPGVPAVSTPYDGQCPISADSGSVCIVYQLAFFHVTTPKSKCGAHYQKVPLAKNKAQCAHACKNTVGCKSFTTEPDCLYECRISMCNANGGSAVCPGSGQCTMDTDTVGAMGGNCTAYEVFR